ncbi:hypothetical protein ABLO27_00580 [Roseibium sp. SCPC15]|uniref:hypothetical protein n=1 Tax=Roseibium sp. SCP15 TaxID=3141376 RepID=UPI00333885A0
MKSLPKIPIPAIVGWLFSSLPAVACQLGPYEYDDPFAPEALTIIAEVTEYDFAISERGACFRTGYAIREVLLGAHVGPLEVEVCYEFEADTRSFEAQSDEWRQSQAEFDQITGNFEGALVMALLTKGSPTNAAPSMLPQSEYRPAITSCWGVFQFNLGDMTDEQRATYLAEIRSGIEEFRLGKTSTEQVGEIQK